MTILSLAVHDLDLRPRRPAIARSLRTAWTASVSPQSLLLRYGEHIIATDRRTIGMLGDGGATWAPLPFTIASVRPSALGDIALTDATGTVYLWAPPHPPRAVWRDERPGSYAAMSLGGDRVLITRVESGEIQDSRAIDTAAGQTLWTFHSSRHLAAVLPHGILAWTAGLDALDCYDVADGTKKWRMRGGPPVDFIALVGDVLWFPASHQLARVDCTSGRRLPNVRVRRTQAPDGVLDDRGVFHCCQGLSYHTYDLTGGGRELASTEFRITDAGPSVGAGRGGTIATADGRFLFADQRSAVWCVHPDHPADPELIWRASDPITTIAAMSGQLLVCEASGTITAFGTRATGSNG